MDAKLLLCSLSTCTFFLISPSLHAVDADFDGIPENQETIIGTSDTNRDSDADGLIDGLEFAYNAILSVNTSNPWMSSGDSQHPAISNDGSKVVFASKKTTLVTGKYDTGEDIYLVDVATGEQQLVSQSKDGVACEENSWDPEISADGRFVVFSSFCTTLLDTPITTNKVQVYLKDIQTGTVELISKNLDDLPGTGHSQFATISKDGRYIAFSSFTPNLISTPVGNYYSDIYIFDQQTQTISLATKSINGEHRSNRYNYNPEFSANGAFVTFDSSASDLVASDNNGVRDVFVYELATGNIELISQDTLGTQYNGPSTHPRLSEDGRYAVFTSWSNFSPEDVNGKLDVYLRDRLEGTTELISLDSNGISVKQHSIASQVSRSGRYVYFRSQVRSMTDDELPPPAYPPTTENIPTNVDFFSYVKDRHTGEMTLITKPFDSNALGGFVEHISLANNGIMAFHAKGSDNSWVENENSPGKDIYITKTGILDVDGPNVYASSALDVDNVMWKTIVLPKSYKRPVIVATPIYDKNSVPLVPRIKNIENDRFQIKVQRTDSDNSALPPVSVNYIVVEEGTYNFYEHGIDMEALRFTSARTDGWTNGWIGESRNFQNNYISPVVIGQVMSYNDEKFSVFWSRGKTAKSVPESQLFVGKHIGEDINSGRAKEEIGYIVFETSQTQLPQFSLESLTTADYVKGMTNGQYQVNLSSSNNTSIAITSAAGMDGANGGWPVVIPNTTDAFGFKVAFDEDQAKDAERKHTTEQVSVVVLTPTP